MDISRVQDPRQSPKKRNKKYPVLPTYSPVPSRTETAPAYITKWEAQHRKQVRTSRYQAISILLWNLAPSAQAFWNLTPFPGDMSSISLLYTDNITLTSYLGCYRAPCTWKPTNILLD
jgi:hypothetical protein